MHYSARAFSRNGQPTIVPVDNSVSLNDLGQRQGLTNLDLQHVATLYCAGKQILWPDASVLYSFSLVQKPNNRTNISIGTYKKVRGYHFFRSLYQRFHCIQKEYLDNYQTDVDLGGPFCCSKNSRAFFEKNGCGVTNH